MQRGSFSIRGSEIVSPFYRAMGGPYRGKLVEFGETVLAHLPEVEKDLKSSTKVGRQMEIRACGWKE